MKKAISNPQVRDLYNLLAKHRGHASAISNAKLAYELDLPPREVRQLIRDLIVEHGVCVCSSVRPPVGYFMPSTEQEIKEYKAQLKSRIIETSRRLRAVDEELAQRIERAVQGELSLF